MNITEHEVTWHQHENLSLQAMYYEPDQPNGVFLVDVHGGAWSSGHRKTGRHYDRLLAERGYRVFAIDFRQGPDYQHPAASADVADAVRYVKNHYNFDTIALIGSSSGGHLALLAGLTPDVPDHQTPGSDTSAAVDAIIAMWPVSNPLARYQYVNFWRQQSKDQWGPQFAPDRLHEGHHAYFGTVANMTGAAIQNVIADGRHTDTPDVLIVQPELDLNVPVFMSETLAGALMAAGANVTYQCYPGVAHGFAHAPGEQTDACIANIDEFLSGNLNRNWT